MSNTIPTRNVAFYKMTALDKGVNPDEIMSGIIDKLQRWNSRNPSKPLYESGNLAFRISPCKYYNSNDNRFFVGVAKKQDTNFPEAINKSTGTDAKFSEEDDENFDMKYETHFCVYFNRGDFPILTVESSFRGPRAMQIKKCFNVLGSLLKGIQGFKLEPLVVLSLEEMQGRLGTIAGITLRAHSENIPKIEEAFREELGEAMGAAHRAEPDADMIEITTSVDLRKAVNAKGDQYQSLANRIIRIFMRKPESEDLFTAAQIRAMDQESDSDRTTVFDLLTKKLGKTVEVEKRRDNSIFFNSNGFFRALVQLNISEFGSTRPA